MVATKSGNDWAFLLTKDRRASRGTDLWRRIREEWSEFFVNTTIKAGSINQTLLV